MWHKPQWKFDFGFVQSCHCQDTLCYGDVLWCALCITRPCDSLSKYQCRCCLSQSVRIMNAWNKHASMIWKYNHVYESWNSFKLTSAIQAWLWFRNNSNCADWWNLRYEGVEPCVRLKALYVVTTSDTKQSLLNHVMANVAFFSIIMGLLSHFSIIFNFKLKEKLKSIPHNTFLNNHWLTKITLHQMCCAHHKSPLSFIVYISVIYNYRALWQGQSLRCLIESVQNEWCKIYWGDTAFSTIAETCIRDSYGKHA